MIDELDRAAATDRPFMFVAHYLDLHLPRKAELLAQFSGDLRPVYAAKLAKLDSQLGQLFTTLKQRGQWDKTIVVITADHGEELNERGYSEHAFHLYDTVLGVPLIVRIPGAACLDRRTPATVLDVLPMVASGLGMAIQSPAITGAWPPVAHGPFFAFSTVGGPFLTIIEDNQKFIVDGRYSDTEVYDLNLDPLEKHDIGGDLTPAIAARLRDIPLPWNPLVPLAQRFRHRHGTEYDVCPGKIDSEPREATAQSTASPPHPPHAFRLQ
jgi:arylsulfatase A-like enzyme